MANAPPVAPANGLPLTGNTTFRSFYADASNDPYAGTYQAVLGSFAVEGANVATPATLASAVASAGVRGDPTSFLFLTNDVANPASPFGMIGMVHGVNKYPVRLGVISPWDDQLFAFKGEVVPPHLVRTVVMPADAFHQVGTIQLVPSHVAASQAFAADNALQVLGPFAANDQGMTQLRVRRSMYCPPLYTSLFLEHDLTPREAFMQVYQIADASGATADVSALLDWLKYMATASAANMPSNGAVPLLTAPAVMSPQENALLDAHRWQIAIRILPSLDPTGLHHGAAHIASSVDSLAAENRSAREAEENRRLARDVKTPDIYFGEGVVTLLRWCHVPTSDSLPPIFQRIAQAPKRTTSMVLQHGLDQVCLDLGRDTMNIMVTPSLATKTLSLAWHTYGTDDLAAGVNVFQFGRKTPAELETQRQAIVLDRLIHNGQAAPSVADISFLVSTDTITLPHDIADARATLWRFIAYAQLMRGGAHVSVVALKRFNSWLEHHDLSVLDAIPRLQTHLAGAYILRYIHIRDALWLSQQAASSTVVAYPDICELFQEVLLQGTTWIPRLPASMLATPPAPPTRAVPAPPPAPPAPPAAGRAPVTGRIPPAPAGVDRRVQNTGHRVALFQEFIGMGIPTKLVRNRAESLGISLPRLPDGSNRIICLAFTVRGSCNENCRCSYDHGAPHSEAFDRDVVLPWCTANWMSSPPPAPGA